MSELPPGPEDLETLAAEHALGVLDSPEREAAQRRELTDPAFATAVDDWRARLARLLDALAPVAPPEGIWPRILRQLGETANVVEMRLRRSLAIWRGVAGVAACIAAALAVVVVMPRPEKSAPVMTSKLDSSATGAVVFVALMDPAHHRVILQPVSIAATPGRSPELWLISNGKPIALGVATFDKPVQLRLSEKPTGTEVLAVSIEPVGGSPTGAPTGPVVATGKLRPL